MNLIVGLGNPGDKYEGTRHNLGFTILDHFLKDIEPVDKSSWENSPKFKSQIYTLEWKPKVGLVKKIILSKPNTFMNNSGMAILNISSFYKISPVDIWVVYDELDLPLGSMKIRFGGGTAGHHGLDSILESLGTDKFWRFRMGIGASKHHEKTARHKFKNTEDFVLNRFSVHDTRTVKHLVKRGSQALKAALEKDIHAAMNRFNTK